MKITTYQIALNRMFPQMRKTNDTILINLILNAESLSLWTSVPIFADLFLAKC